MGQANGGKGTSSVIVAVILAAVAAALPTAGDTAAAAPPPLGASLDATGDEVVSARSARTKRFRLAGAGGFAEVASGRPLHYRDAAGRWRANRAGLAARGADWVAEARGQRIAVRADGIAVGDLAGVLFGSDGRPQMLADRVRTRAFGDALVWEWTLDAAELKLASRPVRGRRGLWTYGFPFTTWGGLPPPALDAAGQLRSGSWAFGRPFVLGADGESYEVARWLLGPAAGALALQVDDRALPAAAFPYVIDPPLSDAAAQAASVAWIPFNGTRVAWDDPQRALTNNNAKAKAVDLAPAPSERTSGLYVHDFGFALAPQAKVLGISIAFDRSVGGCGN